MCSRFVALLMLTLGFTLVKSELSDTCMTSTNQIGQCVLVRDCQYVRNILRSAHPTAEDFRFVEHNICGVIPGKFPFPLICCPVIQNVDGCGVAKLAKRIIGGHETDAGVYPWAGVIEYRNSRRKLSVQCGCALVHHRWVLTAAHCIVDVPRRQSLSVHAVRFNEWNTMKGTNCTFKEDVEVCRAVYEVEEQFPHPSYMIYNPNMRHDIALLKTKVNVEINDYVIPMCLPFSETVQELQIEEEEFIVSGWGETDKDTPGIQRHVTLKGNTVAACNAALKLQKFKLADDQLCIGGEQGQDSCRGDSGGPLMYQNGLITYIVGIVSFGAYDCGTAPGVYTKVADYLEWIEDVMIAN